MATPAGNGAGNSPVNITANAHAEKAPCHQRFLRAMVRSFRLGGLKNGENDLYLKWIALPHPELQLNKYLLDLEIVRGRLLDPSLELQAEVAAKLTEEQKRRFKRLAETYDIQSVFMMLLEFKKELEEIRGVLEAEKEDQLADFDAEDFKRMEKEDQRFQDQKLRDQKQK